MRNAKAFAADRVFTGDNWLKDQTVLVDNGIIADVVASSSVDANMLREKFEGSFLAPAFIDLQIYGAHGKLLAVYPEADSLVKLNDYCRGGGAAFCMPTVATNATEI